MPRPHPITAAVVLAAALAASPARGNGSCVDYTAGPGPSGWGSNRINVATGASVVAVGNGLMFVANGSQLDVYDETDPSPTNGGFLGSLAIEAHTVSVAGTLNCIWVGGTNEMRLVDVSDPTNPVVVKTESVPIGKITQLEARVTPLGLVEMFAAGDAGATAHLFAAHDCTTGLLTQDVATDFTGPVLDVALDDSTGVVLTADSLFTVDLSTSPHAVVQRAAVSGGRNVDFRGGYAYVTGDNGLSVMSVTRAAPAATVGLNALHALAGAVHDDTDDRVYSYDEANGMMHAYDVADPANPTRTFSVWGDYGSFVDADLSNGVVSLMNTDGTTTTLTGLNVGGKAPIPVLHDDPRTFVPSGCDWIPDLQTAAVCGAGSTWVYDTTDPTMPVVTQVFESPAAVDVVLRQTAAGIVMAVGGLADLRFIDLATSTVSTFSIALPQVDLSPDGTLAAAGGSSHFFLFDLTSPANPAVAGSAALANSVNDVSFHHTDGNVLGVATTGTTNLYDLTNPLSPVVTHTAPFTGVRSIRKGPGSSDWFLGTGPTNPQVHRHYFDGSGAGTTLNGFDLSHLTYLPIIGPGARGAGGANPTLYLTSTRGTVAAVDWPENTAPVILGEYTAPGFQPKGIAVSGETILVADNLYPGRTMVLPAHASAGATNAPAPLPAPSATMLGASWPNPFVSATRVPLALTRRTELNLAVFDVTGRKVRELATGAWPGGRHVLSWDGRDASGRAVGSGVYFVRLAAQGRVEHGKVVLTR